MLLHSCGGNEFNVTIKTKALATFHYDEQGNLVPTITQDNIEESLDIESCNQCGEKIADHNTDLVEGAACSECGNAVIASTLNLDNLCDICANPRIELQGLSEYDYIKRIMNLEKELKEARTRTPQVEGEINPDEEI